MNLISSSTCSCETNHLLIPCSPNVSNENFGCLCEIYITQTDIKPIYAYTMFIYNIIKVNDNLDNIYCEMTHLGCNFH